MNIIKAVLFDYDGVIVKPEDTVQAWIQASNIFGFDMNNNDWYELEGMKPDEIAQKVLDKYKVKKITPSQFAEEKNNQFTIISENKGGVADVYEKAECILLYLKTKSVKIGLVTGAIRERVTKKFPAVISYFDTIVAADDRVNGIKIQGKPAPDPWLQAAKNMNVSIKNCIAVENAVLGVRSAKAAQMFCIALQTTVQEELLKKAGADIVFDNHVNLLDYFQKKIKS